MVNLEEIVACPRCLSRLNVSAPKWTFTNPDCDFARDGYPTAGGQPVLVDFERSVFRRTDYNENDTTVLPSGVRFSGSFRTYTNQTFRDRIRQAAYGVNAIGAHNPYGAGCHTGTSGLVLRRRGPVAFRQVWRRGLAT